MWAAVTLVISWMEVSSVAMRFFHHAADEAAHPRYEAHILLPFGAHRSSSPRGRGTLVVTNCGDGNSEDRRPCAAAAVPAHPGKDVVSRGRHGHRQMG